MMNLLHLSHTLRRCLAIGLACCAWSLASAQSVVHHGPSLDIQVQRGEARLPLALVNQLRKGDRLLLQPDASTLTQDGWVLLVARVSLTGTQVESKHFEVKDLKAPAEFEIKADNQVTVIMLAPQLRNLFGLYTSLSESASLLNDVLRSDPQRFYELQKVDQINQAIQVISQGLAKRMAGTSAADGLQAAKDLAAKFGVRTLDPQCVSKDVVNAECVATQIVINKDFALPSDSELHAVMGGKKTDFNSFLLSNVRMFSEASDYLSNKYRDSYDFAPTFGRRDAQSSRVDLYSIARFRSGNVKTAYIYVPFMYSGTAPRWQVASPKPLCYTRGAIDLQAQGKLPLVNYWHHWQMSVSDPNHQQPWGDTTQVSFDPDTGSLRYDPHSMVAVSPQSTPEVRVQVRGQFGFDPVVLEPMRMKLPTPETEVVAQALSGVSDLISGERATLSVRDAAELACLQSMSLQLPDGKTVRTDPNLPNKLTLDLQQTPSGAATLTVQQIGGAAVAVPLRVMPAKAHITRLEHAQGDEGLQVTGTQLERIARIDVGNVQCPAPSFHCEGDVRDNANLPAQATVVHRQDEPAPLRVPLVKTSAKPRVAISSATPNALLITPSAKALQWGLLPNEAYMSEDSGLNLLLQAQAPYALTRGTYTLELRFVGDAASDAHPVTASLIADLAHNELRTRNPVSFGQVDLPSVVNPLEFRVVHSPSGQTSAWQPLPRRVVMLPELQAAQCAASGSGWWLSGKRFDLIDGVRMTDTHAAEFEAAQLVSCPKGLCLNLPAAQGDTFEMRLRWLDDRVFKAKIPGYSPACAP